MRRGLVTWLCFCAAAAVWAQIPNPGLESWQQGGPPAYEYPTGWGTVARATNGLAITCEKSTDKYAGNFAARLFTRDLGFARIPGLLFTGELDIATTSVRGGFPYDSRPERLTGYYKYTPGAGDSCAVFGFLTRALPNGGRDTVAIFFWQGGTAATYTPFSIPLVYLSSAKPDTGLIVISSSINPAMPALNSVMWVDELSFEGSVRTKEPASLLPVRLVPNPAVEAVRLIMVHEGLLRVWVVNAAGQYVESRLLYSGERISVGHLPAGTYFLLVTDAVRAQPLGYATFQRL